MLTCTWDYTGILLSNLYTRGFRVECSWGFVFSAFGALSRTFHGSGKESVESADPAQCIAARGDTT